MRAQPSRALLALIFAAGIAGATSAGAATAPDVAASQPANAVRPEFATPFNAAQDLVKAGKGAEALAKLKEVEALPNQTPYEKYLVTRVRAPAEYTVGDLPAAAADFEAVLASDQLPAADRLPILKAYSQILYSSAQYPKAAVAIQRYLDAGGDDAQLRELLPQTLYMNKDFAGAAKSFKAQVNAQYAAGKTPDEKTLRLLASSQAQSDDDTGYLVTLERLAVAYPKPDYWKELAGRAGHAEKFSDRVFVDVYRLKAGVGQLADSERLTYAALAMRSGYPAETKHVLDEGFTHKAFTGADLGEATKLREQATHAAAQDKAQAAANESAAKTARDGNSLATIGLLDTYDGDAKHGAELIEQGVAKGGLKYPDETRLHLGIAQFYAGRNADALKSFQSVQGSVGLMALAHVWALYVQSQLQAGATPVAATQAPAATAK
jgi:hypothetical protein